MHRRTGRRLLTMETQPPVLGDRYRYPTDAMVRLKRPWLIIGFVALTFASSFVGRIAYVWWHIPEAYAAWDAGDMLGWYMRTHDNAWPDGWAELRAAAESEPALFLRGRHPDEPDYMDRMRNAISIDWDFDPSDPQNPTPILRADGTRLHAYWSDPNRMVYRHLQRDMPDGG